MSPAAVVEAINEAQAEQVGGRRRGLAWQADGVAMKLAVAPGGYSGWWRLEGEELPGVVELRAGRRPVGTLMGASKIQRFGVFPHPAGLVDVLHGRLDNDMQAVLVQTHVEHRAPDRTRVSADLALVGWRVPEDLLFGRVEFQVGGLAELATVRPLEEVRFPTTLHGGAEFAARWNPGSDQRWHSAEGDEIELKFTATIDGGYHYGLNVASSPVMRVRGRPRTAQEWLREYVVPMAELTTLATVRPQRVAWVRVSHDTRKVPAAGVYVFGADIEEQTPYDAAEPAPEQMVSDVHASLIPLGPDGVNLADLLTRWYDLRARHSTFGDYLVLPRTDPQAGARARLLTAVPALEALHDQLHGPPPPGRDERRRNEVLDHLHAMLRHAGHPGPVTDEDLAFLENRLAPSNGYKLAHRLQTLVEHDLDPRLRAQLTGLVDPLPDVLVLEGINNRQDAWDAMATVRNRLGHGTTPVPTPRQITAVLRLANTLAAALALRLLGVPDTALRSGIEHRRWSAL